MVTSQHLYCDDVFSFVQVVNAVLLFICVSNAFVTAQMIVWFEQKETVILSLFTETGAKTCTECDLPRKSIVLKL